MSRTIQQQAVDAVLMANFLGEEPIKVFGMVYIKVPRLVDPVRFEPYRKWDDLMTVVSKIERLGFNVTIGSGGYCRIGESLASPNDIDWKENIEIEDWSLTKREVVYETCLAFIDYYIREKRYE